MSNGKKKLTVKKSCVGGVILMFFSCHIDSPAVV